MPLHTSRLGLARAWHLNPRLKGLVLIILMISLTSLYLIHPVRNFSLLFETTNLLRLCYLYLHPCTDYCRETVSAMPTCALDTGQLMGDWYELQKECRFQNPYAQGEKILASQVALDERQELINGRMGTPDVEHE